MHELSIAMSIIEVAEEYLAKNGGGRVEIVNLRLGPLSGVVKEALLSAYELATEKTALAGSKLLIEDIPVQIHCEKCDKTQPVVSIQEIACAACGTPSENVVNGRQLEIYSMEISDERPAAIG
jgi:hydrogenase nickel incorporation protein HypA/HybF